MSLLFSFVKSIFSFLGMMFLIASILFFLVRLVPGDPAFKILGDYATQEEVEELRKNLGLNLSLTQQYTIFVKNLLQFDLGTSLFSQKTVKEIILKRLVPTIELGFYAILFSIGIAFLLGNFLAYIQSSFLWNMANIFSLLVISIPIFSLAPLLVLCFSLWIPLFPVSEWSNWQHKMLPSLCLGLPLGCVLLRIFKANLDSLKTSLWPIVLKSKGLSKLQILLRLNKYILPSLLTVIALQLSVVLAGTMITETIFDIPGMGPLLLSSIQNRDYPVVQGVVLYSSGLYFFLFHFVSFVNEFLDPRLKKVVL